MLVIIPTAGIGSRLDLHTKHFNKSMIQLGDLPVISRIIESYPANAKFIIILGYKGDQIEEFLSLIYPKKKIKFVYVKNYDGKGSGLTLSLKASIKFINQPFFFHANDSIFTDKNFYKKINKDTMFLSKGKSDTMKYASVEIKKDYKKIHYKMNFLKKGCFNYTGVGFVKDYRLFKKSLLNDQNNKGELAYFKNIEISKVNFVFIKKWFDIGSKETKEVAEKFFLNKKNILPKYDQGIYFKNNKVYKFFTNPTIVEKRFIRSGILTEFVPKILKKKKYLYVYDYIPGEVMSSSKNKLNNFKYLLKFLQNKFWIKKNLPKKKYLEFQSKCSSFYYEKTLSRINFLYEKNNLRDKVEMINNKKINKISNLFGKINWQNLSKGVPVNFHGDLHFENIIIKRNKFKFLDWREDFVDLMDYGDIYYDLAKINHGLILDHNVISSSGYQIENNPKNIKFKFYQSKKNMKCQKILFEFIKKNNFDEKKVKILTSLIFLNIAGLHHYPYSLFLYYLGKFTLNDIIET